MALNGVNTYCAQCRNNCKQYKQIEIILCPKFVSVNKKTTCYSDNFLNISTLIKAQSKSGVSGCVPFSPT